MIVELFGPPGVGKTTLSRALATRLRERGHNVELVLSYRPAEGAASTRSGAASLLPVPAALRRLLRPAVESLAVIGRSGDSDGTRTSAELARLLPPRNVFWSLRMRQYMLRLFRSWSDAARTSDIVLFDQGFVQAVYTFALMARKVDAERMGRALEVVPEADLLVRLDAPLAVLETRLAERRRRQGRIEQLLDLWTTLDSLSLFDQLHTMLGARGRAIARIGSTDTNSLLHGLDSVETIMAGIRGNIVDGRAASWDRTG